MTVALNHFNGNCGVRWPEKCWEESTQKQHRKWRCAKQSVNSSVVKFKCYKNIYTDIWYIQYIYVYRRKLTSVFRHKVVLKKCHQLSAVQWVSKLTRYIKLDCLEIYCIFSVSIITTSNLFLLLFVVFFFADIACSLFFIHAFIYCCCQL